MKNLIIILTLMLGISATSYGSEITYANLPEYKTVKAHTSIQNSVCMEEDGFEGLPCKYRDYEPLDERNGWHQEIMQELEEIELPIKALDLCERIIGHRYVSVRRISETKFSDRVYPGINYGGSSEWKVYASAEFECYPFK